MSASDLFRVPDHVGIATCDMRSAMAEMSRTFGMTWRDAERIEARYAFDGDVVDWVVERAHSVRPSESPTVAGLRFEILMGGPQTTWSTADLVALHHYSFPSRDLDADTALLVSEGWSTELRPAGDGPAAFAYLTRPGSVRVELVDDAFLASVHGTPRLPEGS